MHTRWNNRPYGLCKMNKMWPCDVATHQLSVDGYNGFKRHLFVQRTYSQSQQLAAPISRTFLWRKHTVWIILSPVNTCNMSVLCLDTSAPVPVCLSDSSALVPKCLGYGLSQVWSVCTPNPIHSTSYVAILRWNNQPYGLRKMSKMWACDVATHQLSVIGWNGNFPMWIDDCSMPFRRSAIPKVH